MRRIGISYVLVFVFALFSVLPAGAGVLSKKKAKKVSNYFADKLQGEVVTFGCNDKISLEDIDAKRASVWECWREAVNNYNEEKLIAPYAATEPRDTGYWRLPEDLEPKAVMPYYFIKKGDKPSEGYPLYLYMHGSGDK